MNIRLTLWLLAIVAVLSGWYFNQQTQDDTSLEQLIKREDEPEYTGNRITTSVFDLDGNPQYFAEANEIKRYETTERTEFIQPLLNLFNAETALKQWQLSADNAEITKEKMLHLRGNVKLESLDISSRLQKIETDSLSVDLTTHDIFSDSLVKSSGLGFVTTGKGLTGNLKKQVATLEQDAKTTLVPIEFKQ